MKAKVFGFGGLIDCDGEETVIKGIVQNDIFTNMWSVGSELFCCMLMIMKAINDSKTVIFINSCFDIVKRLGEGTCKPNKPGTSFYVKFIEKHKNKINIIFILTDKNNKQIEKAKNKAIEAVNLKMQSLDLI